MVILNNIQLTGNITKSPELKSIGEGEDAVVVEGRLIHNWKVGTGEQQREKKAVIPFKIYGKSARRFAETVTTKTNVLMNGHLETDEWEHEGQPRSLTFLQVGHFQYNSPKA